MATGVVEPLRIYDQVPLPVVPTMAIPPKTASVSESVICVVVPLSPLMNAVRAIVFAVVDSVVPNEGVLAGRPGAALLASTLIEYCSDTVLPAVLVACRFTTWAVPTCELLGVQVIMPVLASIVIPDGGVPVKE